MVTCGCSKDSFASQARTRIVIQTQSSTPDDAGGRVTTWADALTVWSRVEPMAGRELFLSSQLQSRVDSRMTIRYQSSLADTTVAAKARVKLGTRLFNILASKNLNDDMKTEGKVYQLLYCVEAQPS